MHAPDTDLQHVPDEGAERDVPSALAFSTSHDERILGLLHSAQSQLADGALDVAAVNLWRCAVATGFDDVAILEALTQVFQHFQDIRSIQNVWKRGASAALERGDVSTFLDRTYHAIYAESFYSDAPNYEYAFIDEDVHSYVRLAARALPLAGWVDARRKQLDADDLRSRRLKVGFVLEGFSQMQAPTRNFIPLAEHHDPDQFELYFYSRISLSEPFAAKEKYSLTAAHFEACGATVWTPSRGLASGDQVAALARQIIEDEIDVLVYQTTYFVPVYNLLSALRPAPVQVLIEHQQPEHARDIDLVYTTRKAGLEATTDSAAFPISLARREAADAAREALGLPKDATLLVSANRAARYGQPEFWKAIIDLLDRHEDAVFVAVGLSDAAPLLGDRTDLADRIITPGFREDVMSFLAVSDVYVDIFPSGGGSSTVEAMTMGLPVVTFGQNYRTLYTTNEETLSEYVGDPQLLAPFGDAQRWHEIMDRLLTDHSFRAEASDAMRRRAQSFEPEQVAAAFYGAILQAVATDAVARAA